MGFREMLLIWLLNLIKGVGFRFPEAGKIARVIQECASPSSCVLNQGKFMGKLGSDQRLANQPA